VCTLYFCGREFENFGNDVVDCIIRMSLEWTCNIFQIHEWEWFTFPKVRFYWSIYLYFLPCVSVLCFVISWGQCNLILSLRFWTPLILITFFWFQMICYTIWGLPLVVVLACVWSLMSHLRRLWSLRTLVASPLICFIKCFSWDQVKV